MKTDGTATLWNRVWQWDMTILETLPPDQRSRLAALKTDRGWQLPGDVVIERWLNGWEERAREAVISASLPHWFGRWRKDVEGWQKAPAFLDGINEDQERGPFLSIRDLAAKLEGGRASTASLALDVLDEIAIVRRHTPQGDPVDRYEMFVYASALMSLASHAVPRLELAHGGFADRANLGLRVEAGARRGAFATNSERSGWNEYAFRLICARQVADPTAQRKVVIGWATECVNERQRKLGRKPIGDGAILRAIQRKRQLYEQCLAEAKTEEAKAGG